MSQQINLYDPALRPQRSLISAQRLVVAAIAVLALTGVAAALAQSWLSARKAEARQAAEQLQASQIQVQQLSLQVADLKPDPVLQGEIERIDAQVASRAEVLAVLEKGMTAPENGYAEILRGLARKTLHGLWLTGVNIASGASAMELTGRTLDRALVAQYLQRLNEERIFAGRSFAGLRLEQAKTTDETAAAGRAPAYLEFSLSAGLERASGSEDKAAKPTPTPPKGKQS